MRVKSSYQGKEKVRDFDQAQIIIGRPTDDGVLPDLDLTPDPKVSRPHAKVWMKNEQHLIKDLESLMESVWQSSGFRREWGQYRR